MIKILIDFIHFPNESYFTHVTKEYLLLWLSIVPKEYLYLIYFIINWIINVIYFVAID